MIQMIKNIDDFILTFADENLDRDKMRSVFKLHVEDIEYYQKKALRFEDTLRKREVATKALDISSINECGVILYTIRGQFEELYKKHIYNEITK